MKSHNNMIHSLDGIRAISISLVVLSHWGFGHIIPGGLGVSIFFFISGFLITYLLIKEFEQNNSVNYTQFFKRRILRLAPALIFFLILSYLFIISRKGKVSLDELASALFYYSNYYKIFFGYESLESLIPTQIVYSPFNILWSLSIEEQFYLFFPFLFTSIIRRNHIFVLILSLLLCIPLFLRAYYSYIYENIHLFTYYSSETRFDTLIAGCLFAFIFSKKYHTLISDKKFFLLGAALLLLSLVYREELFRETLRYTIQWIGFLLTFPYILCLNNKTFIYKTLNNRFMLYISKLSYSLYMSHWLAISVATTYFLKFSAIWYICTISLSVAISVLSYSLIEKPFLRLKYRDLMKENRAIDLQKKPL